MKKEYNCIICNKKYFSNREKTFTCGNKKCIVRNDYLRHKKRYIENTKKWKLENPDKAKNHSEKYFKKWRKNNPERFNELMRNGYQRNKDKCQSRKTTLKIMNSGKYLRSIERKCKQCGSRDNLEIHHEEYPDKARDIRCAIENGKIYFKCKMCHGRKNNHKLITSGIPQSLNIYKVLSKNEKILQKKSGGLMIYFTEKECKFYDYDVGDTINLSNMVVRKRGKYDVI